VRPRVPFQRPEIPAQEVVEKYFRAARQAHWFSNEGPCVRLLCERLEDYVGGSVRAIAVASGTLGLMVALRAVASPRDEQREVLVPSFTYVASVSAILWAGFTPVFVDVAPDHWHLDPASLEVALEDRAGRVAAVLACSTFGCAPAQAVTDAWEAACRRAEVPLVVDSAAGFGSRDDAGRRLGRQGAAEVFSFHATKPLAAGEGGAVLTSDSELATLILRSTRFGLDNDRVLADEPGLNAKMSEIHAATALAALDRLDAVVAARAALAEQIRSGLEALGFQFQPGCEQSSWQFVPALAPSPLLRDAILRAAAASSVQVRTYHEPLHAMRGLARYATVGDLEVTRDLSARALSLPLANHLDADQIMQIRSVLTSAAERRAT
jgi:dTDP-4-amino-4,6-dideoxygalactose transaminase